MTTRSRPTGPLRRVKPTVPSASGRFATTPRGSSRAGSRRPAFGSTSSAPDRRFWTPGCASSRTVMISAVHVLGLAGPDAGRELELGSHDAKVRELAVAPDGSRLASIDEEGGLRVWPLAGDGPVRTLDAPAPTAISALGFDASGSRLGWASDGSGPLVWSLADPPDAAPRLLLASGDQTCGAVAFDTAGPVGRSRADLRAALPVVARLAVPPGAGGPHPAPARSRVHPGLAIPRVVRLRRCPTVAAVGRGRPPTPGPAGHRLLVPRHRVRRDERHPAGGGGRQPGPFSCGRTAQRHASSRGSPRPSSSRAPSTPAQGSRPSA